MAAGGLLRPEGPPGRPGSPRALREGRFGLVCEESEQDLSHSDVFWELRLLGVRRGEAAWPAGRVRCGGSDPPARPQPPLCSCCVGDVELRG